jgi:hypothetical protein
LFVGLRRLTLFGLCLLQDHERQFWCPAPLREGEQHRRKLRSDKYQPPAAHLLENYESDSSVEADEDSNTEVGDDAGMHPEASGTMKPRRKTRSVAAKQSVSTAAAKFVAVLTVLTTKIRPSKPRVREKYTTSYMHIFDTNKVPRVVLQFLWTGTHLGGKDTNEPHELGTAAPQGTIGHARAAAPAAGRTCPMPRLRYESCPSLRAQLG